MLGLADAAAGKRRLPVVRSDDAAAICRHVHEQVDVGTAARAQVVAAEGHTIACHAGCNACCHHLATVLAGEAVTIARWLSRPENAGEKARFLASYAAWVRSARRPAPRAGQRHEAR